MKNKRYQVMLSEENDKELRKRTHRKGDVSNIINQALKEYLEKERKT
jgi:hypothetical protein